MLGWLLTVFALVVWGVTFASTRALLVDFSPLEIQLVRFSLARLALVVVVALVSLNGRPIMRRVPRPIFGIIRAP